VTVASPSAQVKTRPEPLPRLEDMGAAEAPLAEDGARVSDPVGPSGVAARSPILTSRQPVASPLFGLYLRRGDEEEAPGYGDFLERLEELNALSLKDQRRHLKNEVFRVSITMPLPGFVLYLTSNSCFALRASCLPPNYWTFIGMP